MEKKGDMLKQLAIISDLFEKANFDVENTTVVFDVKPDEFKRIYELVESKIKMSTKNTNKTFQIQIDKIVFVFNKNSA